jgi:hypothetical protein
MKKKALVTFKRETKDRYFDILGDEFQDENCARGVISRRRYRIMGSILDTNMGR